jgi:hypothetical protein
VIDPSKLLHERAMFYVPPFYEELKKKRCFTRGGFQYQGTYEQSVHRKSLLYSVNTDHENTVSSGIEFQVPPSSKLSA